MSGKRSVFGGLALFSVLAVAAAVVSLVQPGAAWSEDEHTIGVDDLLQIRVWDNTELDRELPVRLDGKIAFPLAGEVQASGLTASQLAQALTEQLGKSVKNPRVSVIVREIRSLRVFLVGRVLRPGVYPMKAGTPLLQALTLAGGPAEGADLSAAYVVRGDQHIPLNLRRLIQEGDLSQNLPLRADDTVVVPEMVASTNLQNSVFIMGEVTRPGSFPQAEALTVMKLVSMAGGFTRFAAPGRITVIRENGVPGNGGESKARQKVRLKVDANAIQRDPKANPDLSLLPGDVVVVPQTLF